MRDTLLHRLAKQLKRIRGRRRLRGARDTSPLRIVLGAGGTRAKGWIASNIECLDLLRPRDWEDCLRTGSVDAFLAEHVWEHLSLEDGLVAARRCHEYLKPGGYIRVAVPDGLHPDAAYIDRVRPNGSGAGADDHRVLYDHRSLSELFTGAGFHVELLEHFDAEGTFHFVDWDAARGKVVRSRRFDDRNREGTLRYTSIILDANKPR